MQTSQVRAGQNNRLCKNLGANRVNYGQLENREFAILARPFRLILAVQFSHCALLGPQNDAILYFLDLQRQVRSTILRRF